MGEIWMKSIIPAHNNSKLQLTSDIHQARAGRIRRRNKPALAQKFEVLIEVENAYTHN